MVTQNTLFCFYASHCGTQKVKSSAEQLSTEPAHHTARAGVIGVSSSRGPVGHAFPNSFVYGFRRD